MMKTGLVVLFGAVLLGGCCTGGSAQEDMLRQQRYELAQREARLKAAERRFKQCVVENYPGEDPGLTPPAPARASAPSSPPPSAGGATGVLTAEQMEEIKSVERVGQASVVSCYTDELERRGNKDLRGKVAVRILIGTNEAATSVTIPQSSLQAPAVHSCIITAIRSWEFPKLTAPTWYSTIFEFSPAY